MREQWDNAVARLGGQPTLAADDLARRYAEPHRKYHNAAHVEAVLRAATELSDEDCPVLVLAICAHDVVYDAKPGDDERASAEWARKWLSEAKVAEEHIARVEALVLATIKHESDDVLAHVLLDADLSILGAAPSDYDAYAHAVRQEYAAVPEELWRAGRAHVLKTLLDRENLYQTARAQALWDAPARRNLTRELAVWVD
jgi:predicted metal-dependent HD superfamily phosphohydrolase